MKVFASWSGGKESCLACYRAMLNGFEVVYLLNFVDEDGTRSRSHGIPSYLLDLQAEALGIPIVHVRTSWDEYERKMKNAVEELKREGIKGGVFGTVDIREHREWHERVCNELQIEPVFPLWGRNPEELLVEFIETGFEAYVIATTLGEAWLGRKIDRAFINNLKKLEIHLCGESGEYHTFVTDGPSFKRGIRITHGKKIVRDGSWLLEIGVELS
ncbi:MAG: diphthine--ammonia ligase [Methanophagales archaeon ANME-1-THS]|nr:MAG: diphthine--ammonia ligase [Methanophagales archaeon ANME-1-THS]